VEAISSDKKIKPEIKSYLSDLVDKLGPKSRVITITRSDAFQLEKIVVDYIMEFCAKYREQFPRKREAPVDIIVNEIKANFYILVHDFEKKCHVHNVYIDEVMNSNLEKTYKFDLCELIKLETFNQNYGGDFLGLRFSIDDKIPKDKAMMAMLKYLVYKYGHFEGMSKTLEKEKMKKINKGFRSFAAVWEIDSMLDRVSKPNKAVPMFKKTMSVHEIMQMQAYERVS